MAKDKEGHGSEAHREGHKPQVEHGGYGKGHHYHDGKMLKVSVSRPIEHRIADIGPGGKEYNVKKSAGWKD